MNQFQTPSNDVPSSYLQGYFLVLRTYEVLPFFIVALLWGITDPLISSSVAEKDQSFEPFDLSLSGMFNKIKRVKFIIAMSINQLGSILYAYLLGIYPEHFSSITANSLTLVVTFIFIKITDKQINNFKCSQFIGLILIIIGIYFLLC